MQKKTENLKKFDFSKPGRKPVFSNSLKTACARNFNAKKLFRASGWKSCWVLHCCLKFQKIRSSVSPLKRRAKAHSAPNLHTAPTGHFIKIGTFVKEGRFL